jgi:hypothetical protein
MVTGEVLPGQMDNFRQLVTRLVAAVAEEPGTLVYEFSLQPAPARRVTRGARLSARSSSSREEPKVRRLVAAVASSYTYAEAVGSQKLPDWIAAHVPPLLISAASPARRSATISRPGSPRPTFTSRWSTGPYEFGRQRISGRGGAARAIRREVGAQRLITPALLLRRASLRGLSARWLCER